MSAFSGSNKVDGRIADRLKSAAFADLLAVTREGVELLLFTPPLRPEALVALIATAPELIDVGRGQYPLVFGRFLSRFILAPITPQPGLVGRIFVERAPRRPAEKVRAFDRTIGECIWA